MKNTKQAVREVTIPGQHDPNDPNTFVVGWHFLAVIEKITSERGTSGNHHIITFEFSNDEEIWFWNHLPVAIYYHKRGHKGLLSAGWKITNTPKPTEAEQEERCAQCDLIWNKGATMCSYCQTTVSKSVPKRN